jgi:hypothetical protein
MLNKTFNLMKMGIICFKGLPYVFNDKRYMGDNSLFIINKRMLHDHNMKYNNLKTEPDHRIQVNLLRNCVSYFWFPTLHQKLDAKKFLNIN